MFTNQCFIRKNSEELRNTLTKFGYQEWDYATKHNNLCAINANPELEGDPAKFDSFDDNFTEKYLINNSFLINCGTNEKLFLAIAALQDLSDKYQWFINEHADNVEWFYCTTDKKPEDKNNFKKATVEQLKKYFS